MAQAEVGYRAVVDAGAGAAEFGSSEALEMGAVGGFEGVLEGGGGKVDEGSESEWEDDEGLHFEAVKIIQ